MFRLTDEYSLAAPSPKDHNVDHLPQAFIQNKIHSNLCQNLSLFGRSHSPEGGGLKADPGAAPPAAEPIRPRATALTASQDKGKFAASTFH